VNLTLDDLAPGINQVLRGWLAYFTAFYSTAVSLSRITGIPQV